MILHKIYWVDLCDGTERRWFPNKRRAKKYGRSMAYMFIMWKQLENM